MIIINDNNVCAICGAYFQNNGYCVNGHLKQEKVEDNCLSCKYLEQSYDGERGTCKCLASKYYSDTMDKNGTCEQHTDKK